MPHAEQKKQSLQRAGAATGGDKSREGLALFGHGALHECHEFNCLNQVI